MHPKYLRYLRGRKASLARREKRYVVRVFHPRGRYPRGKVLSPEALYWGDDDIVFCVTHTKRWIPQDEDSPGTEMDWLTPEELRFIGSILLCENEDGATISFYPVHYYSPVINRKNLNLMKAGTAEALRNLVIDGLRFPEFGHNAEVLQQCLKLRYSLIREGSVDLPRQPQFWRYIKTNDRVLLRGLSALLKADMLSHYTEFFEEATICCFIALEASYRIIVKTLEGDGVKNPDAKDAARWLHEHFDSHLGFDEPLARYFEEFYDQRVMTLHPSSRFGEFAYAPLAHDDYYHLRGSLRSIFGYLVSGTHDRGFLDAIKK